MNIKMKESKELTKVLKRYKAELIVSSFGPEIPCGIRMPKMGSEQFPIPIKTKDDEKKKLP